MIKYNWPEISLPATKRLLLKKAPEYSDLAEVVITISLSWSQKIKSWQIK